MKKAGIVACSNPLEDSFRNKLPLLISKLEQLGFDVVLSSCIFADETGFSGSGQEKARELMKMYEMSEMEMIFDISGGDMANEVIPYLNFEKIASSKATFYGYSDLSTIINSITTATGKNSVLYQIKNLLWEFEEKQTREFSNYVLGESHELFDFEYTFVNGKEMEGILVGGNIRCLLKLAGTPYFPDLKDKILFLEAQGGEIPQMITFLSQLKMLGAFDQVKGIALGTFTNMERKAIQPDIMTLVKKFVKEDLPIIKTYEIGHGPDSKALTIGGYYHFVL